MTIVLLAFVASASPEPSNSNVDSYRNEGRVHLREGRVAEAVVSFRRAFDVAPWHVGAREDLAAIREWVGTTPPPSSLHDRLGPFEVWLSAIVASGLVSTGGVAFRLTHRKKWLIVALPGVSIWFALTILTYPRTPEPFAVVSSKRATLRAGNAESYETKSDGTLPKGAEVVVQGRRGGWLRVKANSGATGWLREGDVIEGN